MSSQEETVPAGAPTILWELPTRGDARGGVRETGPRGGWAPGIDPAVAEHLTDVRPGAFGPFDHLSQVIAAAELAGVDGVFVPYDPDGEESIIVAGTALRETRWSQVVVEIHPAIGSPVYLAKLSATYQRLSANRLGWALRVEVDPDDARRRGDRVTGGDRWRRAAEFLTVAKAVWSGDDVTYDGEHFHVFKGGFKDALAGLPFPTVHLLGNSEEAIALSAEHADVHLFTETPDGEAVDLAARLHERAAAAGRRVRAGLILPVIAREDDDEAWARVARLWREAHPYSSAGCASSAEGEHRHGDRWSAFDQFGFGARTGLVGSYESVADRLRAYTDAGIDTFVLRGHPHIEEVHRLGEHLLHLVDPAGRTLAGSPA